jgi:hypothetical protein
MERDNQQLKQTLAQYSEANSGRRTRLGVISHDGPILNDYWLSNGLPLIDISFDDGHRPALMIRVGELCHSVSEPTKIALIFTRDHSEDGIDVNDKDGTTTMLRFETHV